jgi:hypothetical protein
MYTSSSEWGNKPVQIVIDYTSKQKMLGKSNELQPNSTCYARLIHQCMTKGIIAEGDQLKHCPNWVLARRGRLKIFQDRLECGDWVVAYSDIKNATLYSVRQLIIVIPFPGYVLRIETEDKTYHFGLNPSAYWKNELPFSIERQKGRLKFSLFSIIIRWVLLGYIISILWRIFWG